MKQTWKRKLSMILMAVMWMSAVNPAMVLAAGQATSAENTVSKANAADNGLYGIYKGATYSSGKVLQFYATGAGYGPESPQEQNPVDQSTRFRPVNWSVGGKSGLWTRYTEKAQGGVKNGVYVPGEYRFKASFQLKTAVPGAIPYILRVNYQEEIYNGAIGAWERTENVVSKTVNFYIKDANLKKTQSLSVQPGSLKLTEYGKPKSIKVSKAIGKVEYISSNPRVVKVNSKGKVTPVYRGSAKITIKAKGNKEYYPAQRTVKLTVGRAKINKKQVSLNNGESAKLKVSKVAKKIRWSSSDRSVASVDKKGVVTAKKKGSAVITAKVGKAKYNCKVKVKKYRSISRRSVTLKEGEKSRFSSSLIRKKSAWSSSNPNIATVSETGLVTTLHAGSCKIYATTRQARHYIFHLTVQPANPAPVYNPTPIVNPAPAQPSAIWLSATGEKYHTIPNCGNMNPRTARQVSYEEAVQRGFQPCQKCF
ncbi:MAG: Ig domain-containing protein [Lachnospiraceae bacterium]|nr:Ig domain-containing protein [Lachnospiraceae bacterium]